MLPPISSRESHNTAFSHSQGHQLPLGAVAELVRYAPINGLYLKR
jgi:hypothetical protein